MCQTPVDQLSYQLEFHVSRQARDRYRFDLGLFSTNGNVIFANLHAARRFAQQINDLRDLKAHPELAVRAGQLNAMGLIDEILHQVVEAYRRIINPKAMTKALAWIDDRLDPSLVDNVLLEFCEQFPPLVVYKGQFTAANYLKGHSRHLDGSLVSNRELALEELLMLWIANENPAFQRFGELFDDQNLESKTAYKQVFPELYTFFTTQPKFGPDNENLIDLLQAPARAHPDSLSKQLDFIRTRWVTIIPSIIIRLLSSLDMLREEEKPVFGFGGQPEMRVIEYRGPEFETEEERFSQDVYWMPNLVLLAKNTYVWLDQLARKFGRPIDRLDQVPEEELELLARWGFTGLWLIGLWERSQASRTIKQMRGNPDAVASAYSLFSYDIAADLGGDEAYQVLRDKAWRHGIRLASDMVPNHMGIDSRWVIEHPDWFVQLNYSPFPSYTFNGANLSWDERVGIYIEDHYFSNTDAAVVFKRTDFWTGEERFIYHGNDGTSMPWNDTAQLNYLMPEVREAVIQTILHVARKFPIIRFDAAMTLAKKHYQRLWFPEPGSGGDIPSRAEYGMSKVRFDELFPEEFWRMVVDRVAQEAPDTLLLAEAFWLMEGYFVRTLGMHRVYNSAFMNMLRDEKNQEYRLTIKNTMEFDPQILKRYVNFMNNPDERTAVDQFGKGDKYFGICTMMVTLPGLPMFGHGQLEGFAEKYGMEFRYPKLHEQADTSLVARHERQIFPLIRRRKLFAEAEFFRLYDFYTPEGFVNEDVFAYSNQSGEQRVLVVYHNRFAEVRGWINQSAAYPVKTGQESEKILVQTSLAEALGLQNRGDAFTIFRDFVSGLEYIRPNQEIFHQGLYLELNAYRCLVLMDFRQIMDDDSHSFAQLNAALKGEGVPSIDEAHREHQLRALLLPYTELVNPGMLKWLVENRFVVSGRMPENFQLAVAEADQKVSNLLSALHEFSESDVDTELLRKELSQDLLSLLSASEIKKLLPAKIKPAAQKAVKMLLSGDGNRPGLSSDDPALWGAFISAIFTRKLGKISGEDGFEARSREWIDERLFGKRIQAALQGYGLDPGTSQRCTDLVRVLTAIQGWHKPQKSARDLAKNLIEIWLTDPAARQYLQVHAYDDVLWFNRESFEELSWWSIAIEVISLKSDPNITPAGFEKALETCLQIFNRLDEIKLKSGFQVEKLVDWVK